MPAAVGCGEAASPGGLALGLGGRGGSPVGGRAEPKECQGDSRVRSPAGAHLAALAGRPCVSCGPWRGREAWVCLAWTGRPVRTLPESPGRLWVTAAGVRGAVAQVGEHGPFSPLLARRECPRCPTPSPGSWLRKPLLPRRVALFPSDVYCGPPKLFPPRPGRTLKYDKRGRNAMVSSLGEFGRFFPPKCISFIFDGYNRESLHCFFVEHY